MLHTYRQGCGRRSGGRDLTALGRGEVREGCLEEGGLELDTEGWDLLDDEEEKTKADSEDRALFTG